jgi:hypothetical protein
MKSARSAGRAHVGVKAVTTESVLALETVRLDGGGTVGGGGTTPCRAQVQPSRGKPPGPTSGVGWAGARVGGASSKGASGMGCVPLVLRARPSSKSFPGTTRPTRSACRSKVRSTPSYRCRAGDTGCLPPRILARSTRQARNRSTSASGTCRSGKMPPNHRSRPMLPAVPVPPCRLFPFQRRFHQFHCPFLFRPPLSKDPSNRRPSPAQEVNHEPRTSLSRRLHRVLPWRDIRVRRRRSGIRRRELQPQQRMSLRRSVQSRQAGV